MYFAFGYDWISSYDMHNLATDSNYLECDKCENGKKKKGQRNEHNYLPRGCHFVCWFMTIG